MKNRNFHLFIFAFLLLICSLNAQNSRPNILLILCDDLGYNDVGFNGSKDIITPEIDKLAHGGTIFSSAYVAHPFCGPSRASLLTGRYSQKIGTPFNIRSSNNPIINDQLGVPISEVFMSKILQQSGYYTSAIGKWHLGTTKKFHPNNRGFENFYGFLGGGHNYFPMQYQRIYKAQLKQGKKHIRDNIIPLEHNQKAVKEKEYLTDAFSREAINSIQQSIKKEQPFFIYLAYNAPHTPLEAKQEDLNKFTHIQNKNRRTYAAMVYAIDRGIGKIVTTLKETHQLDNTLIVFLSDNGGSVDHGANNYPLKGIKGDTWEGGYRVPMFFYWPKYIKAGQKVDFPISSLDLYPTFVNRAGANLSQKIPLDGKDILRDLKNNENPHKSDMIYALRYRHGYCDVGARKGDWKITRMGNEPWKLINITHDIGETKNLAGKYPKRLNEMVMDVEKWTKSFVKPLWFYSIKDKELWESGKMPNYKETFEVSKLSQSPYNY